MGAGSGDGSTAGQGLEGCMDSSLVPEPERGQITPLPQDRRGPADSTPAPSSEQSLVFPTFPALSQRINGLGRGTERTRT